jgi:hypothetical protein
MPSKKRNSKAPLTMIRQEFFSLK